MNKNIPNFLKVINEDWFEFFCELGFLFYQNSSSEEGKLNIVLNVPSSNKIIIALAMGIAHAIYSTRAIEKADFSNWISKIKPGTLVFYSPSENTSEKSYIFDGISDLGYPTLKGMGINKGMITTLSKKETWKNIRIAPEQNKYKRQRTLTSDIGIDKINEKYDADSVRQLFNLGSPYFLLIGNENNIREDTQKKVDEDFTIQDFLRIKKFGGRQYSFISECYSSNGDEENIYALGNGIPVVVEGANSFLRYYQDIKINPKVIVLTRSSPLDTTLDALEKIEHLLLTGEINGDEEFLQKISLINVPSNIEILCWREKNE
ncbi:hypothetical protein [Alkalihalobacillus trypoxylicola]|uniref:Uncharacterized protein n=1 Tax=Alkalihalobacillus trypoxylicola TaxID=519424 RepID=A0A162D1K2_9BACI|nr:hypothetical protein [Alkalihalobacillus trypoxylicola]KYG27726.1 hypothetical protein AZF04_11095 [Alkalihalobacillus trypoxylicola]